MNKSAKRFINPSTWVLHTAWTEVYAADRRKHSDAEAWRRHSKSLYDVWYLYMENVLSKTTWLSLCILLERLNDLRWLWIKPGGYFYTLRNNRRKIIKDKFKPKKITVNLRDKIKTADKLYRDSLSEEAEGFENTLTIVTLGITGMIRDGNSFSKDTAGVKSVHLRMNKKKKRFWPWRPNVGSRLKRLQKAGILQKIDEFPPKM